MLAPQEFLLTECDSVAHLLRNTLRYNYGARSSRDIYTECLARIRLIKASAKSTAADDGERLSELRIQLSKVSELIGRVERSHNEEFSWPFADAFEGLAGEVCATSTATGGATLPLVFFSADDDLFSYQIQTEEYAPGLTVQPLVNINFPRSLKSFVLLHPILGHEVGHAAYAIPDLSAEIEDEVIQTLVNGSPLQDRIKFEAWAAATGHAMSSEDLDWAVFSWPEELFCDLFGLLAMGPSFIGAHCSLLFGSDEPSATHPGNPTRYWMLNTAVESLRWRKSSKKATPELSTSVDSYFDSLELKARTVNPKLRLLKKDRIEKATEKLAKMLGSMGKALYTLPPPRQLSDMVRRLNLARPPVESEVSSKLLITNQAVDFRSILYAGWLAWHAAGNKTRSMEFEKLNLLCGRGLIQQCAVEHCR